MFEFFFEFAEIFVFECCSAGPDTPQDFVKRGIRPCRTSVGYKMYTTLLLFCGVWYPARLSSAGPDTLQGLVLRGLIPRRILFCGVSDPADKLRPHRTRRKSFKSLPFSLKGHFSKIGCRRTTLKFEYLREFEHEFEIVLGYEFGAHMGSIHEKNQGPKISCFCTFKQRMSTIIELNRFWLVRERVTYWKAASENYKPASSNTACSSQKVNW